MLGRSLSSSKKVVVPWTSVHGRSRGPGGTHIVENCGRAVVPFVSVALPHLDADPDTLLEEIFNSDHVYRCHRCSPRKPNGAVYGVRPCC